MSQTRGGRDSPSSQQQHQRSISPPVSRFGTATSTTKRKVVTVPSWARNLPPEFQSDDEDELSTSASQTGFINRERRRTISSSVPLKHDANSNASTSSSPAPAYPSDRSAFTPPARLQNSEGDRPSSGLELTGIGTTTDAGGTGNGFPMETSENSGASTSGNHHQGDRWWTFTLPSKYLAKVQDYAKNAGFLGEDHEEEGNRTGDEDEKKGERKYTARGAPAIVVDMDDDAGDGGAGGGKEKRAGQDLTTMSAQLHPPNVFSANQSLTPSWSSPWTPFRREISHTSAFHFSTEITPPPSNKISAFESFILNNPFAPLIFRFFNLALNTCTLAIASHIRLQEHRADVIGVIGISTLFAIIVTPLAMLHIFSNLYIEYFGRPIGLWAVRTKMFHTLTELVFICLYSSILSLAFEDLFTSSLECTSYTPYSRWNVAPSAVGSSKIEGTLANSICNQQVALVVLVFSSVGLYIAVLVVSLLRIFAKVSRK